MKPGDRIQAHLATDVWMMGDRYGTVVKVTSKYVHVKMDVSGRIRKLPHDLVLWS